MSVYDYSKSGSDMTARQWLCLRAEIGQADPYYLFQLLPGECIKRVDIGAECVLYIEMYADVHGDEPYMGYTPGEDDLPERGAIPGERYMA